VTASTLVTTSTNEYWWRNLIQKRLTKLDTVLNMQNPMNVFVGA